MSKTVITLIAELKKTPAPLDYAGIRVFAEKRGLKLTDAQVRRIRQGLKPR